MELHQDEDAVYNGFHVYSFCYTKSASHFRNHAYKEQEL